MPNHFHALIGFSNSGKNINRIIGNGKRFMPAGRQVHVQANGVLQIARRIIFIVQPILLQRDAGDLSG